MELQKEKIRIVMVMTRLPLVEKKILKSILAETTNAVVYLLKLLSLNVVRDMTLIKA